MIEAVVGVIFLIVFFVMTSNIGETNRNTKKILELLKKRYE